MKKLKLFILPILGLMACGQHSTVTPSEKLKEKIQNSVAEGKIYFGHHDDPVYGHTWTGEEGRSDVLETAGKYPGMMSWDLGKLEWGHEKNLDGVPFERMRKEVIAQDKRGGINTFSWHADNAVTGLDPWKVDDKTQVSLMVNSPEGKDAYLKQLDYLADFFNSLEDENGNKIGVIFRPWHEHTGSWFWWGRENCSVEDYKALWSIMRDRFDEKGVNNILWAFSPGGCEDISVFMERYPGDEYVDIIGTDVYHFGGEENIDQYRKEASTSINMASSEARKRNKLSAFTETGLESIVIDNWFTEILLPVLKENPVAYVTVWRNAYGSPTHFYAPFKGHASENDFKKFSEDSSIIFVDK